MRLPSHHLYTIKRSGGQRLTLAVDIIACVLSDLSRVSDLSQQRAWL